MDSKYEWKEGEKLFNVGNVIHGYNVSIFIGLILCFFGIVYFWKRMKYSWSILQIMLIIAIPTGIFGARIWDLVWSGQSWSSFFTFAGLSIQGGVIFGMIFTAPYVWYVRRQVDFRTVFSIVMPNILIGQAIGRFGNFFNHELYGHVTSSESLDWMGIMKDHMYIIDGDLSRAYYRQPLFFYESMSSLFGWALLVPFLLRKNWLKPGVVGALYWVWYGIWRAALDGLKKHQMGVETTGVHIAVILAILSIIIGLIFAIYWQWIYKPLKKINPKNKHLRLLTSFLRNVTEYEKIYPIKPRKKYEFFGEKTDNKKKYVFFGPEIPNRVIIYIPIEEKEKWSKKEIIRGKKNKN